jgi:hypothetical protein
MAFFDHLGEALRKIRLMGESREMNRQSICEGTHPIDWHHFDRAPRPQWPWIKSPREADKFRRLAIEMVKS